MDLQQLVNDKNILYIYEIGLQIHGLFEDIDDRDFLLVVTDDYEVPELDEHFDVYTISDWFQLVLKNSMITWICMCLPKKYIIKEHVKLYMQPNLLYIRRNFDDIFTSRHECAINRLLDEGNTLTAQKAVWEKCKFIKFANQIIDNNKIVNFKEVAEDYKQIVDGQVTDFNQIKDAFTKCCQKELDRFLTYTDHLIRLNKINKRKLDE